MILAIIVPILWYAGLGIAALLTGAGIGFGMRASRSPRTPNIPEDVLPHSRSGTNRYPPSHDVFTGNLQDHLSYSSVTPPLLNTNTYLDNLTDYRNAAYGSEYMRLLSYNIRTSGANQSIDRALVNTTNTMNSWYITQHRPLYRLGNNSNINAPVRDFEVLVITGSPNGPLDNDFISGCRFDSHMLRHAARRTYGDSCRDFQILDDPNRAELEAAIIARTQSSRRNNRRLYIVYLGHGNHDGYQQGITASDQRLEGSRRFVFALSRIRLGFNEDDYKNLLNTHASDLHVTSIFHACHSGAAITADEPFFRRNVGAA